MLDRRMMFVLLSMNMCFYISGSPDALVVSKAVFEYNVWILIDLGMWTIALLFVAYLLLTLSYPAREEENRALAKLIFDDCS